MKPWLRSVLGVMTGIAVIVAGSALFHRVALALTDIAEDRPTPAYHLTELLVVGIASALAGYFVARIDSGSPMAHGVVLALLVLLWYGLNLPKAYGGRGFTFLLGMTLGMPLLVLLGAAAETRRLRAQTQALEAPTR